MAVTVLHGFDYTICAVNNAVCNLVRFSLLADDEQAGERRAELTIDRLPAIGLNNDESVGGDGRIFPFVRLHLVASNKVVCNQPRAYVVDVFHSFITPAIADCMSSRDSSADLASHWSIASGRFQFTPTFAWTAAAYDW